MSRPFPGEAQGDLPRDPLLFRLWRGRRGCASGHPARTSSGSGGDPAEDDGGSRAPSSSSPSPGDAAPAPAPRLLPRPRRGSLLPLLPPQAAQGEEEEEGEEEAQAQEAQEQGPIEPGVLVQGEEEAQEGEEEPQVPFKDLLLLSIGPSTLYICGGGGGGGVRGCRTGSELWQLHTKQSREQPEASLKWEEETNKFLLFKKSFHELFVDELVVVVIIFGR